MNAADNGWHPRLGFPQKPMVLLNEAAAGRPEYYRAVVLGVDAKRSRVQLQWVHVPGRRVFWLPLDSDRIWQRSYKADHWVKLPKEGAWRPLPVAHEYIYTPPPCKHAAPALQTQRASGGMSNSGRDKQQHRKRKPQADSAGSSGRAKQQRREQPDTGLGQVQQEQQQQHQWRQQQQQQQWRRGRENGNHIAYSTAMFQPATGTMEQWRRGPLQQHAVQLEASPTAAGIIAGSTAAGSTVKRDASVGGSSISSVERKPHWPVGSEQHHHKHQSRKLRGMGRVEAILAGAAAAPAGSTAAALSAAAHISSGDEAYSCGGDEACKLPYKGAGKAEGVAAAAEAFDSAVDNERSGSSSSDGGSSQCSHDGMLPAGTLMAPSKGRG